MRFVARAGKSMRRPAALSVVLALLVTAGCKRDVAKEESAATAGPDDSATPAASAETAAEEAGGAVGDGARSMERTRVSRSRETVRSDAPKTKAVVGN